MFLGCDGREEHRQSDNDGSGHHRKQGRGGVRERDRWKRVDARYISEQKSRLDMGQMAGPGFSMADPDPLPGWSRRTVGSESGRRCNGRSGVERERGR